MNPRLVDIPTGVNFFNHLVLPSYFTMVTVGFILGLIVLRNWAKQNNIDPHLMVDFVIWMAIWGILGSRALHLIADGHFWDYVHACTDPSKVDWKVDIRECKALKGNWEAAREICHPVKTNCFAWADLTAGGFAFYGGFVAAALFAISFVRKHKLPSGKLVDIASILLMLGLGWGRMGCFLAGCCFGMRTDCVLGVVFPKRSPASRYQWEIEALDTYRVESLPVHPTQLYEAVAGLLIAAVAYFLIMPRKRFDGQVFCITVTMYAVARFMLEFIRRDERGGLLGLSTSQLVAVVFVGASVWFWIYFSRSSKKLLGKREADEQ